MIRSEMKWRGAIYFPTVEFIPQTIGGIRGINIYE